VLPTVDYPSDGAHECDDGDHDDDVVH
jgi:hypothetical protein